ncbi:hypothetical protein LTR78_010358 [Recurvomyces mirabilis]|uniref:Uncharacterized protein n=1 Tax=Recurvomyces mirabilis TaxID=574656 RepID=A0AAE0TN11_9PEZI|nr:hypothetical protein LTR78_010358 [Recurvomyces mirabilis]KAK5156202.1 hypothetical protein LTS14_005089 [Recurvomyces mirabilis]
MISLHDPVSSALTPPGVRPLPNPLNRGLTVGMTRGQNKAHLIQHYLPHLYDAVLTLNLTFDEAIQHLMYQGSNNLVGIAGSSSTRLYAYLPHHIETIFLRVLETITKYGHDESLLTHKILRHLEKEADKDAAAEDLWFDPWLGEDHERTIRLFRTLAEVSLLSHSYWLGSVLALFFQQERHELLTSAPQGEVYEWACNIGRSCMGRGEQVQCLKVVERYSPGVVNAVFGGGSRGGRYPVRPSMPRASSSLELVPLGSNRSLRPSGAGYSPPRRRRSRNALDDDYDDDFGLRPRPPLLGSGRRPRSRFRDQSRRSRLVADFRRIEDQVENVLDAAEVLQEETRELREITGRR